MVELDGRDLWGNEAAEDEALEVLSSYFIYQPSFSVFFDPGTPLSICRARKGIGKSALLRQCLHDVRNAHPEALTILAKGADLLAQKPIVATTPDEYIHDWQQRLCSLIIRHIGQCIGVALTDDAITIVEAAELAGYKQRNLVGALIDRVSGVLGTLSIKKPEAANPIALLRRFASAGDRPIWLLIDDIDATFVYSEQNALRISTFFSACRELTTSFKGVNIRTAVRPDVWRSLRRVDEALDKCEQYVIDIDWSRRMLTSLLTERVRSYLERSGLLALIEPHARVSIGNTKISEDDAAVLGVVFERSLKPFSTPRPPQSVIHAFAMGRPR